MNIVLECIKRKKESKKEREKEVRTTNTLSGRAHTKLSYLSLFLFFSPSPTVLFFFTLVLVPFLFLGAPPPSTSTTAYLCHHYRPPSLSLFLLFSILSLPLHYVHSLLVHPIGFTSFLTMELRSAPSSNQQALL